MINLKIHENVVIWTSCLSYLKWDEQAPRTSLWHLISLSSVSKVTSKKSSSFLNCWNAVDKFDVKSFHFKQYFSPSTEPMVAVTILFSLTHITFSCQSFILEEIEKLFFSLLDFLLASSDLSQWFPLVTLKLPIERCVLFPKYDDQKYPFSAQFRLSSLHSSLFSTWFAAVAVSVVWQLMALSPLTSQKMSKSFT